MRGSPKWSLHWCRGNRLRVLLAPGYEALHRTAGAPGPSEHGVVVRRALRYGLQHIPVLDDLAVLQAEEVRRGGAAVFGRGLYQAVCHDHVALGDGAPDVEAQLGELLHEALYELDERLEAIWCLGVVLDVVRSAVLFHRLGRLPVVERQIEVSEHRLLVLLGVGHGFSFVGVPFRREHDATGPSLV